MCECCGDHVRYLQGDELFDEPFGPVVEFTVPEGVELEVETISMLVGTIFDDSFSLIGFGSPITCEYIRGARVYSKAYWDTALEVWYLTFGRGLTYNYSLSHATAIYNSHLPFTHLAAGDKIRLTIDTSSDPTSALDGVVISGMNVAGA